MDGVKLRRISVGFWSEPQRTLAHMNDFWSATRKTARFIKDAALETVWPTRCCLCDAPGFTLCPSCERDLPYLDRWTACPTCGAAFGLIQCTECSPVRLERLNRSRIPFDECASAVRFTAETGRLVRTFKDQGEQRLTLDMARLMHACIHPEWDLDAVAFIPASSSALIRRGFDHGELLARAFCAETGLALVNALDRPDSKDQRALSRAERIRNLTGRFDARPDACRRRSILLIDDVLTTGSTLFDATDALREAGARSVFCLTFARV